jgi:hypothetical protein
MLDTFPGFLSNPQSCDLIFGLWDVDYANLANNAFVRPTLAVPDVASAFDSPTFAISLVGHAYTLAHPLNALCAVCTTTAKG